MVSAFPLPNEGELVAFRARLQGLLDEIPTKVDALPAPENTCEKPCLIAAPYIQLKAAPASLVRGAAVPNECLDSPKLKYVRRSAFRKIIAEWFLATAQGTGDDGINLSGRCNPHCAPQYELSMEKSPEDIEGTLIVTCGPPSDPADKTYQFTIKSIWRCESHHFVA